MPSATGPSEPSRRQLPTSTQLNTLQSGTRAHGLSSRSGTSTPTTGSATQTITNASPRESQSPEPSLVLRLRGAHNPSETDTHSRRIKWAEDVVDNEGLGRKSSKVCCIYHKPKGADESSDESSSDSASDASDSADDGAAKPVGGKGKRKRRNCGHAHEHDASHEKRKPSPNAYERQPKSKSGKT